MSSGVTCLPVFFDENQRPHSVGQGDRHISYRCKKFTAILPGGGFRSLPKYLFCLELLGKIGLLLSLLEA